MYNHIVKGVCTIQKKGIGSDSGRNRIAVSRQGYQVRSNSDFGYCTGVAVHRPYSAKSKLHENAILRDLHGPECIENAFCVHCEACCCERSEQ